MHVVWQHRQCTEMNPLNMKELPASFPRKTRREAHQSCFTSDECGEKLLIKCSIKLNSIQLAAFRRPQDLRRNGDPRGRDTNETVLMTNDSLQSTLGFRVRRRWQSLLRWIRRPFFFFGLCSLSVFWEQLPTLPKKLATTAAVKRGVSAVYSLIYINQTTSIVSCENLGTWKQELIKFASVRRLFGGTEFWVKICEDF